MKSKCQGGGQDLRSGRLVTIIVPISEGLGGAKLYRRMNSQKCIYLDLEVRCKIGFGAESKFLVKQVVKEAKGFPSFLDKHEPAFAGALGGEVPVRFGWVSAGAAVEQEPTCQPMCGDKTLASGVPLASQCLGTELWRVGWGGKGQTCARPASGPGEWLLASGTQHIGEWDPAQDRF